MIGSLTLPLPGKTNDTRNLNNTSYRGNIIQQCRMITLFFKLLYSGGHFKIFKSWKFGTILRLHPARYIVAS